MTLFDYTLEMHEVHEKIWVGSMPPAGFDEHPDFKARKIDTVVSMTGSWGGRSLVFASPDAPSRSGGPSRLDGYRSLDSFARKPPIVMSFPMRDAESQSAIPDKDRLERFLQAVNTVSDEAILFHCQAGLNRSAFAAAAFLHLQRDRPIRSAIHAVKQRGNAVLFNQTFVRVLNQWYGS